MIPPEPPEPEARSTLTVTVTVTVLRAGGRRQCPRAVRWRAANDLTVTVTVTARVPVACPSGTLDHCYIALFWLYTTLAT